MADERTALEIVVTESDSGRRADSAPLPFTGEEPERASQPVQPPPFPPSAPQQESAYVPEPGKDPIMATVGGIKVNLADPAYKSILEFVEAQGAATKGLKEMQQAATDGAKEFAFWFKGRKFAPDAGEIDYRSEAQKLVQMEERRAKLKAAYEEVAGKSAVEEIREPDVPEAKPVDPRMEALRRLNAEKNRAESERQYNLMKFGQEEAPEKKDPGREMFELGMLASMSGYGRLGSIMGAMGKAGIGGEALGGLAGGAAQAAGPVALAFAISEAVKSGVRGAFETAGNVGGRAAALDPGVFLDWQEGAASMLGKFSVAGVAIEETIKGVRKFHSALLDTAESMRRLNPDIAIARARSDVRELLGTFQRGQLLGEDLGRVVDANSRLKEAGRDSLAVLLRPFLTRFAGLLEKLATLAERGVPVAERAANFIEASFLQLEANKEAIEAIAEGLTGQWGAAAQSLVESGMKTAEAAALIAGKVNQAVKPPVTFDVLSILGIQDPGMHNFLDQEERIREGHEQKRGARAFNPRAVDPRAIQP